MPYIKQEYRESLEATLNQVHNILLYIPKEAQAGCLTYIIYKLLMDLSVNAKYEDLATLLGCVDSASKEFYRRKVAKYEDKKIEENGDVV